MRPFWRSVVFLCSCLTERSLFVVKALGVLTMAVLLFSACDMKFKPFEDDENEHRIEVCRYDRLESQYLTTGDFSALQQMNMDYPIETRTLLEDVLRIGEVNDPKINHKFLAFFQDSTLQAIVSDAESQYANMDDINIQLNGAFETLKKHIPEMPIPVVYAQISALDQSIVIGNQTIGISLDKYLGKDYPLYKKYYSPSQRETMSREYIVPECLSFYLLSLYPMHDFEYRSQLERDLHMGKIMWVCNVALERKFFKTRYVNAVDKYMCSNKKVDIEALLKNNDYSNLIRIIKKEG